MWSHSSHVTECICSDSRHLDHICLQSFVRLRWGWHRSHRVHGATEDSHSSPRAAAYPSSAVSHVYWLGLLHIRTHRWLFSLIYDSLSPKRIRGSLQNWLIAIGWTGFGANVGFLLEESFTTLSLPVAQRQEWAQRCTGRLIHSCSPCPFCALEVPAHFRNCLR